MGLLDEAIREHLDLKRRRGADPGEVQRLEQEALGPVRRAQQAPADLIPDYDSSAGMDYADEEEAHEWTEAPDDAPLFDRAFAPDPEGVAEPERGTQERDLAAERSYEAPRHHEIAEEWDDHGQHPLHGEGPGLEPDVHAPAVPPPIPSSSAEGERQLPPDVAESSTGRTAPTEQDDLEGETAEYDIEAELEGHRGEDDVLEETPEFLQDTPDHERLWFEQRPPRDFDFDG
jgi:hypothetical protein